MAPSRNLHKNCRRQAAFSPPWLVVAAILTAFILSRKLACPPCAAAQERRPNVVVILTDDQGWGDLSIHGNTNLATPNIDELAGQGAILRRFYVCPVCSPTRAEFLTGRYHPRGGVYSTSTGGERLDLDEQTMAELFQRAGYATAAFGKWHNGMQYPYHPNGRGFDEYYGFCSGHWGNYFDPILEHNGKLVRGKGYIADDFTEHALQFITDHRAGPFFCYLPYCTPHSPMQVPDRFYRKFDGADLAMRHRDPGKEDLAHSRAALAMCENIDYNVGRVLKKLDELKIADNTILVYFTDNGPNGWRYNGGMKGRKGSTDEGGVHVPCFIRWPGAIDAGVEIEQVAGAIDLLPTLTDLAKVSREQLKKPLDGVSLEPQLLRSAPGDSERLLFSHWSGRVSVRSQRWVLDQAGNLFDILADPRQDQPVTDQHPEEAQRLRRLVQQWKEELLPGLRDDDRPFPVGFAEFPITHLPARDGQPHGQVQRSARAPNCSYFTNWTTLQDSITWDVEVATEGVYQVQVYYTCPAADVGATFELSLLGKTLQGKITEAHDPPLVGEQQDRSSRGSESLVKDFRPLDIGQIRLPAGRDLLTLRATKIPGDRVMDVRYVVLTLQQ